LLSEFAEAERSGAAMRWTKRVVMLSSIFGACVLVAWHAGRMPSLVSGFQTVGLWRSPFGAVQNKPSMGLSATICGSEGGNCTKTHCCAKAGLQCYQKHETWAACMKTCTPGKMANDVNSDPWSCKKLGVRNDFEDELAFRCAKPGVDCRMASCCSTGSCYLKDVGFGSCHAVCPSGWKCTKLY